MLLFFTALFAHAALAALYTNPVRMNGPDPFIVWDDGFYYLTTTTNVDLEITRATTIDGLRTDGARKTVYTTKALAAASVTWAPEIHKINGKWYMYYSAPDQNVENAGSQGSHVLEGGSSPWDPYHYKAQITNETLWSIDGTVLKLNSNHYFVWSCITTAWDAVGGQHLCISQLQNPWTISKRVTVISSPTLPWEQVGLLVNEGPQPLYHGNDTFLTYSASFCGTSSYALGLLKYLGGDPLLASSWYKSQEPVFTTADGNGNYGPGHNGIFVSPDGTETWNVFHTVQNPNGACDETRYTMVLPVTFNGTGWPDFGIIPYIGVPLTGPSGEPQQKNIVPP